MGLACTACAFFWPLELCLSLFAILSKAVTKIRSRVSTGDECPGGRAVFQTTFFSGPNSSGRPVDTETPLPFGPRNCTQSSATGLASRPAVSQVAINGVINKVRMIFIAFDHHVPGIQSFLV